MAKVVTAFRATRIANSTEDNPTPADLEEAKELADSIEEDSQDVNNLIITNQVQEAIDVLEDIEIATGALLRFLRKDN